MFEETRVNGLTMKLGANGSTNKGKVLYYISTGEYPKSVVESFPGIRRLKRLAKKFLNCSYEEYCRRQDASEGGYMQHLGFYIDKGISQEDRSAFLAAVISHTHFIHPR